MTKQENKPEIPATNVSDKPIENRSSVAKTETPLFVVPDKFKNADGSLNVAALMQSYLALEKKLNERLTAPTGTRPATPEEYIVDIKSNLMTNDPEINKRLFDLGFTNEQVQAVYDIAAEKVVPVILSLSETFQTDRDLSDLAQTFGGVERFNTIARQISSWGEKNLDRSVFETLAASKDGIMTLYKMMCGDRENTVLPRTESSAHNDSEEDLKRLMQNPKYWKQQDPEWVKRVEDGFKRLYGDRDS